MITTDFSRIQLLEKEMIDRCIDGQSFADVLALIGKTTGVDLSLYKEGTIKRRIIRRMEATHKLELQEYLRILMNEETEVLKLFGDILIGVTRFFRDPEAFDALQERIIPVLCAESGDLPIRVWVVGCSTGQETYSLAILFNEYLEKIGTKKQVKLFSTDIDRRSIEYASTGFFPLDIASEISPERLSHFFIKKPNGYLIHPRIREQVDFACHNIACDPPFRHIDLISCRNLLIYFSPELQKIAFSNFDFSLKPSGYLFLGLSENVDPATMDYTPFIARFKIFKHVNTQYGENS